ncbi:MAG: hypothetical protein FWE89_03880, partial [Syntrophaceae bacterium]|nr:hypothetical protein [Syntrophaceae bacterium]
MARREVGYTQIRPIHSRILVLLFLVIIFSVPLIEHLAAFRDYVAGERRSPLPQAYEALTLLPEALKAQAVSETSGLLPRVFAVNRILLKEMMEFEETLDDQSIAGKWLRPQVQSILTGWFGAGNEKAYCGENSWLFYRPDVDYLSGAPFLDPAQLRKRVAGGSEWVVPPEPDPRVAILDLKAQLDRRGIALIVMPTPAKPMIHPEALNRRYGNRRTVLQNPSYDSFLTDLEQHGVLLFDSAKALLEEKLRSGRPLYLETDTHWRPEAMAVAAQELKAFIERHVPLDAAPDPGYRTEAAEVTQLGDLAVMLDLPAHQRFFPRETVLLRRVLERDGQEPWKPQQTADILVLGDSFSNIYSLESMEWGTAAGFVEQLSYLL